MTERGTLNDNTHEIVRRENQKDMQAFADALAAHIKSKGIG